MGNTRLMKTDEFDKELATEAAKLRDEIPAMRYELLHDPEGCFGGRGNNIGERILRNAEGRQGELVYQGYTRRADDFAKLVAAGVDPAPVYQLSFVEKDRKGRRNVLRINCENGHGRPIAGRKYEGVWIRIDGEWRDAEPSGCVIERAEAIARALGFEGLEAFRGEYTTPRVYKW